MNRQDLPVVQNTVTVDRGIQVFNQLVTSIRGYGRVPTLDDLAALTGMTAPIVLNTLAHLHVWGWIIYTPATGHIEITRPTETLYTDAENALVFQSVKKVERRKSRKQRKVNRDEAVAKARRLAIRRAVRPFSG